MATQIPLRSVRIPALQRQCLFLRHQRLNRPFAAAASRTFSSTPSHARDVSMKVTAQLRAAAKAEAKPSPRVYKEKMQRSEEVMVEDIGLLQGTIVRAPLSELPKARTLAFWSYFWALLKSKGLALWSRSIHRRMLQKQGLSRFLPVDVFGNKALKDRAQLMYKHMYTSLAEGNTTALRKICLPPLANQLKDRIIARRNLEITWELHEWKSVKVVSHRSAPLGEDRPDSAFRQAIIRLESVQSVTRKQNNDIAKAALKRLRLRASQPAWIPEEARQKLTQTPETEESKETAVSATFAHNSEMKTVVEYMVLQARAIRGVEQEWKIWGFTEESTPETLKSDEEYWSRQLAFQAARTGGV